MIKRFCDKCGQELTLAWQDACNPNFVSIINQYFTPDWKCVVTLTHIETKEKVDLCPQCFATRLKIIADQMENFS